MSKKLVLCLVLVLNSCAVPTARLPEDLRTVLERYPVPLAHMGLYIAPLGGSGPPITVNAQKPFNPASTMKLLPALAALELLSPAYQWFTRIYTTGGLSDGVLHGNLYIQGGGDPYLTVESAWAMLKSVRARGIDRIAGDIVVDDSVFSLPEFDPGAFDDRPYRVYNGPAGGLMLNFWAVRFTIKALPDGVRIDAFPESRRLQVVNHIRHSHARCTGSSRRIGFSVEQTGERVVVSFDGVLSDRCPPVTMSRAPIPAERYVQYVLPGLWRAAGGALDGRVRSGLVPQDASLVYVHPSATVAQVVSATNKFSNNLMARQLLLTLGTIHKDREVRVVDGIRALKSWLAARHIDVPGLRIVNGSGLSRSGRISAQGLANVLRAGTTSRYAPEFLASFPIAGADPMAEDRRFESYEPKVVRIKTGLLDNVRTMAGYIATGDGDTYIAVLLINHPGVHLGLGTRIQDAVIQYLLAR